MRLVVLAACLVSLPLAVASAAPPSSELLFTATGAGGVLDVFVSAQDGSGRLSLTGGGFGFDPSWSPDGSSVAYVSSPSPRGGGGSDVYVAEVGSSTPRQLTFDFPGGSSKSAPTWSPDGRTIAYLATAGGNTDVWTVPAVGGQSPTRVTSSGGQKFGLAWSPAGGLLVTTQDTSPGRSVVTIDAATGATTSTTQGAAPVWSPDGTRLAYVDAGAHVSVMDAGGSSSHELTGLVSTDPVWSPDGARVVFGAFFVETSLPETRTGPPARSDIYEAPADASAPPRPLTGPLDPLLEPRTTPYRPVYSPDGTQITYHADDGTVWRMNADGTCEQPVPGLVGLDEGPYWRPGSMTGTVSCVDLSLHAVVDPGPFALGQLAPVQAIVENHGNQAAHNVALHVTGATPASSFPACDPAGACFLGTVPAGASRTVYLGVTAHQPGTPGLQLTLTSTDSDLTPSDMTAGVSTAILPCTLVGTEGPDHLQGTAGPDRICGLRGDDWISGGRGNDYLNGGSGNDTIFGGPGHDTILGRDGRDVIFARDGERDWIDCGNGYDIAVVDRIDHVRNCERVLRAR
jgi:Tol biopolymer transport system component